MNLLIIKYHSKYCRNISHKNTSNKWDHSAVARCQRTKYATMEQPAKLTTELQRSSNLIHKKYFFFFSGEKIQRIEWFFLSWARCRNQSLDRCAVCYSTAKKLNCSKRFRTKLDQNVKISSYNTDQTHSHTLSIVQNGVCRTQKKLCEWPHGTSQML